MNFLGNITSNVLRGKSQQETDGASGDGGKNSQNKEIDDVDLVKLAQGGDYKAFDALVTRHRGKVYAMIMNMVKNDAEALPKFENRSKFSTWLFRISHNVVYDWMRKKKIRSEGELDDELLDVNRIDMSAATAPRQSKRPDEAMTGNELKQQIDEALNKLTPHHKETILLREVQGMDYKEIAEVMGCTLGTVMSRLFYARKKLQTLLKP